LQTNWIAFSLSDSYARKFRTIRGFPSESKVVTLMFHPAGILGNMRRHGRRSMDLADFVSSSCCSRQALSRPDCRRVSEKDILRFKNFLHTASDRPAKSPVVTGPPGRRHTLKCVGERSRHMLGNRSQNTGVVMAKTAKSRAWTKDNIRELKTLARQKVPVAKIAKSLKRTLRATQQKAYSIGVSLNSRG
jgi:hypothetical protein